MTNRVKTLRSNHGWTQSELGERLGVSRYAVLAIETGKHRPSLDLAFRMAVLFGETVEGVFDNPHRQD